MSTPLVPMSAAKIGIIGLGNVGKLVASNVLRTGMKLQGIYDINTEQTSKFAKSHRVKVSTDVSQLTNDCDVIVTALPLPEHVRQVVEHEVLPAMRANSIWIDHSTTDYEQTLRLTEKVQTKAKGHVLEAPVTGGIALLRQGMMTTLVGGDRNLFEHCRPLLSASCANLLYTGEMGTATITKVLSNMLAGAHTVLCGEALMLAKRGGVDLRAFFDGIRLSAGNSYVFETEVPLVFNGTYDPEFSLQLHCKDFALGSAMARKFDSPIEVYSLIEQIYNKARIRYGNQAGSSHPPKLLEETMDESLQIPGFERWTYSIEQVTGGSLGVVQKNIDAHSDDSGIPWKN